MVRTLLMVLGILISSLASTSLVSAQEEHQLTVANWSFEVNGAVKASQFSEGVHLGALDDGRDWLIVMLTGINTSSETQKIHSDRIQLQAGGEMIKQTGKESDDTASELGYTTIGGSFPMDVDAGAVLQIVQVYKVAPELTEFTLVFDFSGKWEVPISDLVAVSAGKPGVLLGQSPDQSASTPPAMDDPWSISTSNFQITLIGAAKAPTFTGPFHLGMLDDGRSWLVVTYRVANTSDGDIEIASESLSILSEGEEIRQAGEETRGVAGELELVAPALEIGPGESVEAVQVFKVVPEAMDNTFQVDANGKWFIDLRTVIETASGDPSAVVPATSVDLAALDVGRDAPQAVPTAAPTPTPDPTPTPEPTAMPRYGSAGNPGQVGDTLEVEGMAGTVISGFYTYEHNFSTPKGGYVLLILDVQLQNVGSETLNYDSMYFAARDTDREIDFDDTFVFLDSPLGHGELSPGEYVYGQVALEIQETSTSVRVKYTVSPGLFGDSEALYWWVPRQ